MPPEVEAAKDSTRTPNMSSRRRTPAIAPLSAKANVPERSRIRTSVRSSSSVADDSIIAAPPPAHPSCPSLLVRQYGEHALDMVVELLHVVAQEALCRFHRHVAVVGDQLWCEQIGRASCRAGVCQYV